MLIDGAALLEQQPPVFGFGWVFGLDVTLDGCVVVPSLLLAPPQHEPPVLAVVGVGAGGATGAFEAPPPQQEPPFDAFGGAGGGATFGVLAVDTAPFCAIIAPGGNMPGICGNIGYMMGWWKPPLTAPIMDMAPYSIPGLGACMPAIPFAWGKAFAWAMS